MWDTLHTAFDRSRGTLGTVGGGGWGKCIAWRRPVGGTTVMTDAATSSVKTLSYFVISYFRIFLLLFTDLRLGYSDIHTVISDTSLASLSTNQKPIRSNPPCPSPPHCA